MVDYNNVLDFVFPYFPESARNVRMSISYHGIGSKVMMLRF